jgi:hypothetical protein
VPAALVAAAGLTRLQERRPVGHWLTVLLCAALAAQALLSSLELSHLPARPLDQRLASLPAATVVAELPLDAGGVAGAVAMAHAARHGLQLVNGHGPVLPRGYREFGEQADGFPELRAVAALMKKDVGLVVLHTDRLPPAERSRRLAQADALVDFLRRLPASGRSVLYQLDSSFEARQRINKLIFDSTPPLPRLEGRPCFEPGEQLHYRVLAADLLEPARLRLRVLPAEQADQLVLRLDLQPTRMGRRYLPGPLSLEDRVDRGALGPERLELRLQDQQGIHVYTTVFQREGDRLYTLGREGQRSEVEADSLTPLAAIYTGRCLRAKMDDRFKLALVSTNVRQELEARVAGVETVQLSGRAVQARKVILETPVGGQGPLRGGRISLWYAERPDGVPVKLELTPPAGFMSLHAELMESGGSP